MPINTSAQIRKGRQRAAADAASLLNYHPEHETPPAWALRRLRAFPATWALHASERLGEAEPAPVTFGGRLAEEVRAAA